MEYDNYFLAEIDRNIFHFHPRTQQHELQLALYLTERWRQVAREGTFDEAISMADLLASSMIRVDKANLTARFAPRIEQALQTLWQQGMIGAPARCITPTTAASRWGKAWLASQWIILPPPEIRDFYKATFPDQSLLHTPRRSKKV